MCRTICNCRAAASTPVHSTFSSDEVEHLINMTPSSPTQTASRDPSQPLQHDIPSDEDPEDLYFRFDSSGIPREETAGPAILEALPLLRRPSVHLDRRKNNAVLGTGHGSTYGSDDGTGSDDSGDSLVPVQSGVKKVEAITLLWTKKSLMVAYVR